MGDKLPGEQPSGQRSAIMRAVPRKDSKPEMVVRRVLHSLGYRFRLHRRDLPGTPDIVLPKHKLAIFVHGCFWHRHPGCRLTTTPKTRVEFWVQKFEANTARDERNVEALERLGWRTVTIWECETRGPGYEGRLIEAVHDGVKGASS